ncbi:MAG: Lrp/AsnC ligand binding domain-containing protein, partial [Acidobacteria bacterium]|nr:Lrp/AsnC ligand binding domain-containing protein [Acidobacteriota bacterium]
MINPGVLRPPGRGTNGGLLLGKADAFAFVEFADANALDQWVLGKITDAPGVQATETHIVLPSSVRQSQNSSLEDNQMNTGRFAGAVIGVWIVRVALNATFYTQIVGRQFEQMSSAHPGMFRTVIPAYIVTDLIFALV